MYQATQQLYVPPLNHLRQEIRQYLDLRRLPGTPTSPRIPVHSRATAEEEESVVAGQSCNSAASTSGDDLNSSRGPLVSAGSDAFAATDDVASVAVAEVAFVQESKAAAVVVAAMHLGTGPPSSSRAFPTDPFRPIYLRLVRPIQCTKTNHRPC